MEGVGFGRVAHNSFIAKNVKCQEFYFIALSEYYFRENCTIRTIDICWYMFVNKFAM